MTPQAREIARLTGLSAWHGFLGFYDSDNLTYAAAIAYYGLLSLFPFLMLVVAGGTLLLAMLLVSASSVVGAEWFADVAGQFPGLLVLRSLTIRFASTALFIVVVALVYYFVPNAKVRFRDVWIGALVTGLLWKVTIEGFSWFMGDMSRFTRVNGSIAAVVVFLVWVYLQAAILLYGVEFTAADSRLILGRPGEAPAAPAPRA